ncbi:fecCD transport family protein, partial [Yersinia pestis PY-36]
MTKTHNPPDLSVMGRYQNIVRHRLLVMGVLVLAILGCLLLDFTMGPSGLTLSSLWQTLIDPASADAGTRVIVWGIRLPYALM